MSLRNEMIRIALSVLEEKREYFSAFGVIADEKAEWFGALRQYKTENWLQAEIAVELLRQGLLVGTNITIDGYQWDIACTLRGNPEEPAYLALKCYAHSAQNPTNEAQFVVHDVQQVFAGGHPNRAALTVLPHEGAPFTDALLQAVQANCPEDEFPSRCSNVGPALLITWWGRDLPN